MSDYDDRPEFSGTELPTPVYPRELLVNSRNRNVLKSLMLEAEKDLAPQGLDRTPVFTFAKEDKVSPKSNVTCLSMYRLYMEQADEYYAAIRILGDYGHWVELCNSPYFKPHIELWREERRVKEKALANVCLMEQARNGNVTAARAIASGEKEKKRGRPSAKERKEKLNEEVEKDEFLAASLAIQETIKTPKQSKKTLN